MSRPTKCDECENEFDATDRAYQAQGSDGLFCSEYCAGKFDGLKGPHTNVPLEERRRTAGCWSVWSPRHWPGIRPYNLDEIEPDEIELLEVVS